MNPPIKIFADFNNTDQEGRVRLTTVGGRRDIERMGIQLQNGLEVILDDDEGLTTVGIISFSEDEKIWVARINWDEIM